MTRGFYINTIGTVYYVTGGRKYQVPNQEEFWRAAAGQFNSSPWELVVSGYDAQLSALPDGDYSAIALGSFPIGGDSGVSGSTGSTGAPGPTGGAVTVPGIGSVSTDSLYLGIAAVAAVLVVLYLVLRR